MITAILNGYKRGNVLNEQIEALKNQTIPPTEILIWYNNPGGEYEINHNIPDDIPVAYCNANLGVWARFTFALMAKNPYICVFDDDTIPGSKWFENCLNTIQVNNGLLGTIGLIYPNPRPPHESSYNEHYYRVGWDGNNDRTVQVDFVGHAWFFRREWLSYMFRELPHPKYNLCGEDMHFSYMLQKYGGIKTFVPPHPANNKEMWGSIKGWEYGVGKTALWENNHPILDGTPVQTAGNMFFREQRIKGWRLINDK